MSASYPLTCLVSSVCTDAMSFPTSSLLTWPSLFSAEEGWIEGRSERGWEGGREELREGGRERGWEGGGGRRRIGFVISQLLTDPGLHEVCFPGELEVLA